MPHGGHFLQPVCARPEGRRPGAESQGTGGRRPPRRRCLPPVGELGEGRLGEGMSPVEETTDSLSSLEERIQRAVQLVARLRQEKEAALEEGAELRSQVERLTDEV